MIQPNVRAQIKGYLEGFVQSMIVDFKPSNIAPTDLRPLLDHSPDGSSKPFHESMLPDGILRLAELERFFSTRLGATFEECAMLIATQKFKVTTRKYRLLGSVSAAALSTIDSIASDIDNNGMQHDYLELVQTVANTYSSDTTSLERPRLFDLHLEDHDGREHFFEMKSPKPNKDQCTRSTARLLLAHAIRRQDSVSIRTYYAMPYNPYGSQRSHYKHSFAMRYLDMQNQVLLADEFWELLGGPGSYNELLDIYREVGREKGPDIIENLLS